MTVVGPSTTVRLHPLRSRRDREEWIVGRLDTGDFVALPPVGERALALLADGRTVAEVGAELAVDAEAFVHSLLDLGFVRAVDGRELAAAPPRPASLPWLTPRRARWAVSPVLPALLGPLVLAALGVLAAEPGLFPGYQALLWSRHGSLVIGVGATVGWLLLLLHELAHLVVARAVGVPARIRLGTRLQFLVVQTDISGIELAPRRHRLTAYLAGIATNLTVAAAGVLGLVVTSGGAHRALAVLVLLALLPLPFQCLVFTRTDLYFVLQELTGCRDLHGDGRAYARHLLRRRGPDPSLALPPHERRAVRAYSVLLAVGTVLCLAAFATLTLPADLTLLLRAAARPAELDSMVVLLVVGGAQALWLVTFVRRRRRSGRVRGSRYP